MQPAFHTPIKEIVIFFWGGESTYIVGSFRPDFEDLAQPQLNTLNKQMLLKLNQLDIPNWDLVLIPMSI